MKLTVLCSFLLASLCAQADDGVESTIVNYDANEPAGFLTELINRGIERSMQTAESESEPMKFGRQLTDWATAPKFGGYYVGSYKYSSARGADGGPGFDTRLIRTYVDGKVLRHFAYRIQMEMQKTVHLKDAFIEYQQIPEARIKFGQFKRPFGFENPMNPWDVGVGDFSQFTKKLSGFSDYTYPQFNGSNGGRDLGIQLQGDFWNVSWGGAKHAFIHYQGGVFNGQGINTKDANRGKDLIGTLQLQPIKGLFVGVFGWRGSAKHEGIEAIKRRWAAGVKFDRKDWTVRAEYGHEGGSSIAQLKKLDADRTGSFTDEELRRGNAQALYLTVGAPLTPWLKIYGKWDAFTEDTFKERQEIYSLCPNFQLHKHLQLQAQWNVVHDNASHITHHELWAMAYVRF